MMGLQHLTGEKIRIKMRLGCIKVVFNDFTDEKIIIDASRGVL